MQKKKILWLLVIAAIVSFVAYTKCRGYYSPGDRVDKLAKYDEFSEKPVGWLMVQGTNIDFPIVYDNGYVDLTAPEYELGWTYSKYKKLPNHVTIMSHNVLNVSSHPIIGDKAHKRFEQLMAYIYYDFVKENKYIQYTTTGKNYLYKIYSVYFIESSLMKPKNYDKQQIISYFKKTKSKSYFDFSVNANKNDKLLTLITCTRFFGEEKYYFVVEARKVRKYELPINYKVKKNKKYKEIESILEGDD